MEKWVGQRRFWRVAFVSGEPLTNAFAIRGNDPISGDQAARYGALDCGGSVKCRSPSRRTASVAGSVIEVFDHGGLVCGVPAETLLG